MRGPSLVVGVVAKSHQEVVLKSSTMFGTCIVARVVCGIIPIPLAFILLSLQIHLPFLLLCLLVSPLALRAQNEAPVWVAEMTARIHTHFGLEGDLHLVPVSGGTFAPKPGATVSIVEFPSGISAQILLRVRTEVTGEASQEQTVVLRANLWRSGWKLRQPSQRGDLLDPSSLEPVRIGDGANVGAGSVVKGDIPAFALAVGSPAKVVGRRTQVF